MLHSVLWSEILSKALRLMRWPAYLPTGKGPALYRVKVINIPRAGSEVTKRHSALRSLCAINTDEGTRRKS